MRSTTSSKGFSLIELVVALGIAGFLVAAAMESFRMQNETYTVVDQTTEVQQNMRAIANLLERDIRSTGLMVPEGLSACGVDNTNASDVLFVTDTDALFPFNAAGNQMIEMESMFSVANVPATTGAQTITLDSLILEDIAANAFYDTDGAGGADSDFQIGGGVIVMNEDQPELGTACATINGVNIGASSLQVTFLSANNIPVGPGERLVAVPAHVYQILNPGPPVGPVGGTFDLQRNGQILASDVEDFQVSWFIDDGGAVPVVSDNLPIAAETRGANGSPVYLSVDPAPAGTDHRRLREIRVNLVVRTRSNSPRGNQDAFIQAGMQAMENRVLAAVPNDGYRRRVHTTTVRLRNVGWRGQMSKKLGI